MNQSAIQAEIAILQLRLRQMKKDYESALINEVEFDHLKIMRQAIKETEEALHFLQSKMEAA